MRLERPGLDLHQLLECEDQLTKRSGSVLGGARRVRMQLTRAFAVGRAHGRDGRTAFHADNLIRVAGELLRPSRHRVAIVAHHSWRR